MDRSDVTHVMYDKKGPVVAKNFSKRGFDAYYCPTCEEALQKAIALIPQDHVISWGGSTSINEIGLRPYALENHRVIDRDTAKTGRPRLRAETSRRHRRHEQGHADSRISHGQGPLRSRSDQCPAFCRLKIAVLPYRHLSSLHQRRFELRPAPAYTHLPSGRADQDHPRRRKPRFLRLQTVGDAAF